MHELIEWLLDASVFSPRGQCGTWEHWLAVSYQAGNWAIAVSYFVIGGILAGVWKFKRPILPMPDMVLAFGMFIFACGCTHILDAMSFYWPAYRFFTIVELLTATVSLYTALRLPSAVRHIFSLPTPEEYRVQTAELEQAVQEREETIRQAKVVNDRLANDLALANASLDRMSASIDIVSKVHGLDREIEDVRLNLERIRVHAKIE